MVNPRLSISSICFTILFSSAIGIAQRLVKMSIIAWPSNTFKPSYKVENGIPCPSAATRTPGYLPDLYQSIALAIDCSVADIFSTYALPLPMVLA